MLMYAYNDLIMNPYHIISDHSLPTPKFDLSKNALRAQLSPSSALGLVKTDYLLKRVKNYPIHFYYAFMHNFMNTKKQPIQIKN